MTWQIANVKKSLASIGRMCDAGNIAVFTKEGGYVVPQEVMKRTMSSLEKMENKTLKMEREGGVYNFLLWVPKPPGCIKTTNRYDVLRGLQEQGGILCGWEWTSCRW